MRSYQVFGASQRVRIARRGIVFCTLSGDQAEPVPAAIAAMSCRRWFCPEPHDYLGRLTLMDALRVLDASDEQLRSLTQTTMFELIVQELRSGHVVAYLGDVREPRQASSAGTATAPAAAPPPPAPEPVPSPPRQYSCRWQHCLGEHVEDINPAYPNNGVLVHGKDSNQVDYAKAWIAAGREPWKEAGGASVDPQASRADYQHDLVETDEPKPRNLTMIDLAESALPGQYVTQKHHLISVHLFDLVSSLKVNARLIGYNANDGINGICLPYFKLDIVRHDRQCHRGSHPSAYDDSVLSLLLNLEVEAEHFCESDQQTELIARLERISARVRQQVLAWKKGWYLRTRAEAERADAYRRIGQDIPV